MLQVRLKVTYYDTHTSSIRIYTTHTGIYTEIHTSIYRQHTPIHILVYMQCICILQMHYYYTHTSIYIRVRILLYVQGAANLERPSSILVYMRMLKH
jgi:hypothetical protein